MKISSLSILAAAALFAGGTPSGLAAEQVEFKDLPEPVQRTVNKHVGAGGIASIQRVTRDGVQIYEVRRSERGNAQPFYVAHSGALVNVDNVVAARPAQEGARKATFRELPIPVQNTVRGQAGVARVEDIDVVTKNGETTYNVAFKQEGKTVELWVDPNGNILNQGAQQATGAQARGSLAGALKVKPEDLPAAVKNTLSAYTKGARIEDVDKGTSQGRTVYEAAFKRDGKHVEFRVAEDGTVIRDDVNDRFLADIGQPAPGTVVGRAQTAATRPSWALTPARAPLTSASKVTFRQLPQAVRDTLRTYSGDTRIEDVDKGTIGGTTVYQAAFKHNDENVELRIAENGSLVKDRENERFIAQLGRQGAEGGVGQAPSWQVLTGGESSSAELTNPRRLRFEQAPPDVQSTLRIQAGRSPIDTLRQGIVDGKAVYEGTFKQDGATKTVRMAPDGSVLNPDGSLLK